MKVLTLLLVCLTLASCSELTNIQPSAQPTIEKAENLPLLVGSWKCQEAFYGGSIETTYSYKEDGTYASECTSDKFIAETVVTNTIKGTWRINKGNIIRSVTSLSIDSKDRHISRSVTSNEEHSNHIANISDTDFTLTIPIGETITSQCERIQ